ncbi:MAG: hypothetical protein HN909_04540 [Phycisphaerales bacterium]|nr:hypothetical protein [Phycisphaerales bacterium]MBT7171019.1 hypothetical protein [Phycisphaerales bacterium]
MMKRIIGLMIVLTAQMALASGLTIGNDALERTLSVEGGVLKTVSIENKVAKITATPTACDEFHLRISKGTHITGTDVDLTAADFKVIGSIVGADGIAVRLENAKHGLKVTVRYTITPDAPWMNKTLEITPKNDVCLERIDVEQISFADAHQPYRLKEITSAARGRWSPGLGQPLYTTKSATFWGIEFPAAYNSVTKTQMSCGYLWGRTVKAGATYTTYPAVVGVGDDGKFIQDTFFEYINAIRVRPLRLQIQYNSWFDYHRDVSRESFLASVNKVHSELVETRGNKPLKAYVIDDGWQDVNASWKDKVWPVNKKFDVDFASAKKAMAASKSNLGLWLSPGCLFGAEKAIPGMKALGWESISPWMSMAGPKYMGKLEERMVELTKTGVTYFKLDGVFGHLNTRNFELNGDRYGIPYMPQLRTKGMSGGNKKLNSSNYDELKMYYLVAGTERLMQIFAKMAKANPDVYIVISNGAYLSSWWLQHIDSVWMINAGDAAGGSQRTDELVYRDGRYHRIYGRENTQFPQCALFNHEPKKTKSGETKDSFRRYLYMNISRGTGFIELYLKTFNLKDFDWDVLSEGLHWSQDVFPTFHRSRMHGGDPAKHEVYGHTAWTKTQGYLSIHNPNKKPQTYTMKLDRAFGLVPGSGTFKLSSPIADCTAGLKAEYSYGDTITLELRPREIRILNFDKTVRDWSKLRALQTRTKVENTEPAAAPPVPSVSLKGHAVVGTWVYVGKGAGHTREFTAEGQCILRQGKKLIWTKPVTKASEKSVVVEGKYMHTIDKDGMMNIESRHTAKKK